MRGTGSTGVCWRLLRAQGTGAIRRGTPPMDSRQRLAAGTRRARPTPIAVTLVAAMLVVAAAAATPPAVRAADAEIVLSNDFLAGNPFDDDLYTASFGIDVRVSGRRVGIEERMFTDKTRGIRFDETQALVELRTRELGRWNLFTRVGALHVGRGLFGQEAQNLIHRAIGDREEFLDYPGDRSTLHALAEMALERPAALPLPGGVVMAPALELSTAPGFKSNALAALKTRWRLGRDWSAHADVGYRLTHTDFAPLEPRIRESGPAVRLAVGWRDRIHVTWTENRYGTGARHLAFHVRVP